MGTFKYAVSLRRSAAFDAMIGRLSAARFEHLAELFRHRHASFGRGGRDFGCSVDVVSQALAARLPPIGQVLFLDLVDVIAHLGRNVVRPEMFPPLG